MTASHPAVRKERGAGDPAATPPHHALAGDERQGEEVSAPPRSSLCYVFSI